MAKDQLLKRLDNDYIYHAPTEDQVVKYNQIRSQAKDLAITFVNLCPESRELSVALTHLEEAVMQANAAIARNIIKE